MQPTYPSAGSAPTEPMTDLARLLAGPRADANLRVLLQALETDAQRVSQEMRRGLGPEDYAQAEHRLRALGCAQLILKSLQIYLAR